METLKTLFQKKSTILYMVLMVPSICIWFFFEYSAVIKTTNKEIIYSFNTYSFNTSEYVLYSPKCKILHMDPFNAEVRGFNKDRPYVTCNKLKLLVYTTKIENNTKVVLHIDETLVPKYSKFGVECCWSNITRERFENESIDNHVNISKHCTSFKFNTTLTTVPVMVECRNARTKREVYRNPHTSTLITKDVQQKIHGFERTKQPLSVLIIGIDSVSRLNLYRSMKRTRKYLSNNNWLELKAYNKIGDNTFPNLMAILTGMNDTQVYDICSPQNQTKFDACDMLWKHFAERGYVTGYAEDSAKIGTFNYNKQGFSKVPVDYYYRPYVIAAFTLKKTVIDTMSYCTGPESEGERILNIAKDFAVTFNHTPSFGFFWMNTFSHNQVSTPSRMDRKVEEFLKYIDKNGVLKNSIVFFMSDHGMRFGDIVLTTTGWFEERLPMMWISVPQWFKETYVEEYENLQINANKLTSPFDLHLTLQDVLAYSTSNYTVKPANGCPSCKSMFKEISTNRSCPDAGIGPHWCTCNSFKRIKSTSKIAQKGAEFVVDSVNKEIANSNDKEYKKCAKYQFKNVVMAAVTTVDEFTYQNSLYMLLFVETKQSATFGSTLKLIGPEHFELEQSVSRLDRYESKSKCVANPRLQYLCTCRKSFFF